MKPLNIPGKIIVRRHLGMITVVLVGLIGSLALYHFARYAEQQRVQEEFFRRAAVRHALISEKIHDYEECVYNVRTLFANSDNVTPAEFQAATQDILTRHQGIQALQWVPVVPDSHRAEFEAWARREIAPSYRITERAGDGPLMAAITRPEYRPILYAEPLAGNEPALGFDLAVGPTSPDLARSVRTRSLVMTRKIHLLQEKAGAHPFGVIMACPVFQTEKGVERLLGFVQIVFELDDMLGQSWINYPAFTLDTLILDKTGQSEGDPFLFSRRANTTSTSRPLHSTADFPPGTIHRDELTIGGRIWECCYSPTAGWIDQQISATPQLIFAGGLLFTLVLSAYVLSVRHRSELVRQQVNERTGELRHTQGLLEADIGKRQAVEAELRESRRQLDSLLGQMPGMAYRYAHKTPSTALFISRGSIEIIGFTPHELTSGQVIYADLILQEDRALHRMTVGTALSRQGAYESEYRIQDKHGCLKWVLDRGQGIYSNEGTLLFIEGLAIDITGRKQAEADKTAFDRKLLESQKLESLGVLAGGIAHDFNNLLTTIVGHASMLGLDLPKLSPLQMHIKQIEAGVLRASELCQQMLAYAGKGRFLVQRTSLEKLVRDTTPLLKHSISKRALLQFEFRPGVPEIEVDATQIRQIIMNLVVNASDAIGDHDGTITVETSVLRRDDPQLRHAVLPPPPGKSDFACLRVRDTGAGMSAATLGKIFDPFFTTKFTGRGLGLAAVLGIVRSHEGSLLVTSTVNAGSVFTLLLPAASTPAVARVSTPPFDTRAQPIAGTVLLIDDEDGVRAVAEQMFVTLGLKTLTAADGAEGVELFIKNQAAISLVLLDLTMPRMNGEESLRAIRLLAPNMPVILMSGYNQSAVPELASDDRVSFLQKPFSLQALRTEISKMLN